MNIVEQAIDNIDPRVSVVLRALRASWHNDEIRSLIKRLVARGSAAVDIGANRGVYTWLMSSGVGRSGRVHSIEPVPSNASKLTKLARLRKNIVVHPVAASQQPGYMDLHVPMYGGQEIDALSTLHRPTNVASHPLRIAVQPLDDLLSGESRPISFIKIDVEGHEDAVLEGARSTIRDHRPPVVVEVEQRHRDEPVEAVFEHFQELGYSGYFLHAGGAHPLDEFDLERHQLAFLDGGFTPYSMPVGYVSDFLFLPPTPGSAAPPP